MFNVYEGQGALTLTMFSFELSFWDGKQTSLIVEFLGRRGIDGEKGSKRAYFTPFFGVVNFNLKKKSINSLVLKLQKQFKNLMVLPEKTWYVHDNTKMGKWSKSLYKIMHHKAGVERP